MANNSKTFRLVSDIRWWVTLGWWGVWCNDSCQVQIQDEAVFISLTTNTLGKGKNQSLYLPAMDK